jgi:hypothetical protein
MLSVNFAECRKLAYDAECRKLVYDAECHYADYRYAECHGALQYCSMVYQRKRFNSTFSP